jgi:hypothetical protein
MSNKKNHPYTPKNQKLAGSKILTKSQNHSTVSCSPDWPLLCELPEN